jgi:hypothetical protein
LWPDHDKSICGGVQHWSALEDARVAAGNETAATVFTYCVEESDAVRSFPIGDSQSVFKE